MAAAVGEESALRVHREQKCILPVHRDQWCTKIFVACAKEARELKGSGDVEVPSIYVGESSRSIQERSIEHWADFKKESNKSHILKHQSMVHGGGAPSFIMRAVSFHKTALSRQVAEAEREQY